MTTICIIKRDHAADIITDKWIMLTQLDTHLHTELSKSRSPHATRGVQSIDQASTETCNNSGKLDYIHVPVLDIGSGLENK